MKSIICFITLFVSQSVLAVNTNHMLVDFEVRAWAGGVFILLADPQPYNPEGCNLAIHMFLKMIMNR